MALTKVTGGTISTTSNYEVGVITATKFVGPFEGAVSGIATGASKVITSVESSDTTCFPLFVNSSTDAYQAPKLGSNLTFNSSTGDLGATKVTAEQFVGNISGTGATFTTVDISGTLNYTHVTDVYSVGVGTFASNVQVGAGISVVGVSTFTNGVGIADSIFHTGDNNTAIKFDTDTVTVETGGSEALRVSSDQRVGIGTIAPQRIIHAFEPTANNLLFLESGDTNTDIIQADTGGSTRIRNSQGSLVFYVNGDAKSSSAANAVTGLTIDGDKDVHVYDDLFIPDKIIHEGDTNTSIRFPSDDTITAETGSTERLRIRNDGNILAANDLAVVGITTSAGYDLSAISATAYDSSNVVDICVYDTSQDTDGGEWRKRCGGTSWHQETFSATRGSKKEFPAIAVIVLVGGTVSSYGSDNNSQKICIYDGDDPTLPLWMEFQGHADEDAFIRGAANYAQTSVDMFNGQMIIGRNGGYGIAIVNFIQDRLISYWDTGNIGYYDGSISERNTGKGVLNSSGYGIDNVTIKDVAITAIKDSPIDITTGLPYPTMALATADGINVIRSSQGSEKEKYETWTSKATNGSYNAVEKVAMNRYNNKLYAIVEGGSFGLLYEYDLPWAKNYSSGTLTGYTGVAWLHYLPHGIQGTSGVHNSYWPKYTNTNMALRKNGEIWTVSGDGVSVIKPDFNATYTMEKNAFVAGIGTHHNTGWMYGGVGHASGCKIGSLCETTTGILGDVGTNLVPNWSFSSDINGWDVISGSESYTTATHQTNVLQIAASGGTARVEEEVTVEVGKRYTYEYRCVSNSGGANFSHLSTASNNSGTSYAVNIGYSATGYHQHTFTATATSLFIQLGSTNGNTAQFDMVRVYETSECVDNGYFNTTADGQPGYDNGDNTVDGWDGVSNAELSIDNYALKIEHSQSGSWAGGGAKFNMGSKFVPGVQYRVSYRIKTGGVSGNFSQGIGSRIQKNNEGHSNWTLTTLFNETSDPGSSWVEKVSYFTAERTTYGIHFYNYYGTDGFIFYIDNLSVKPVANSYAITNNFQGKPKGIEPRGRITKSAVASGAELCCYHNFDSYNSLVQRYDTELDYGTGDFYYMVWVNTTMNAVGNLEGLISRQTDGQSSGNRIQIQADNNRNVWLYCGGFSNDTTANLSKGGWTHLAFIRRGEMGYVYEDGRLRKYFDDTTNYTNSGANLRIGGLSLGSSIEDNSYPADQTKFALFKTGGIAPSEQELRKIVIEERKFFGTNVKCTLHGGSDYQIPAVACDTASDTVHVGTGSGRSEFDGLLRINNTTDAITVAVSASNGLVAEE